MSEIKQYERLMGIDYGSVRIGISITDPMCLIAQPIEALKNDSSIYANLKQIAIEKNIKLVVVGMPVNLKGQEGKKAEEVQKFIECLKRNLNIEIVTWDERFTTTIAGKTLLAMGTKKKERQKKDGRIDSMAAAVMLQGYLDRIKHTNSL